jgi:predicted DNA-binding transcriptional regulator YafY
MNLTRLNRLLQMVLLQAGKGHNVDSLSARCGISRGTVFRDLEVLRQASVPLTSDDEFQVYHLADTSFLPPTKFSAAEALVVLVLCHELGDVRQMPFLPPAHERRCVRIQYDSLCERSVIQTRLSPYRLVFSRHSWYVIGRSSLHRSVRIFKLTRIRELELTDDSYEIPRNFSLDRYLGNAGHIVPDSGPDYEMVVHFRKKVARNVAEVKWHKTQSLEWNDDGTLNFRVKVSGLSEVSWWILGYGDEAEVIKPSALRKLIATPSRKMLRKYEDDGYPVIPTAISQSQPTRIVV